MRVYVASAYGDFARTRAMHERLRWHGHTIAHDWTVNAELGVSDPSPRSVAASYAAADLRGVDLCELLVLLTSQLPGAGMWVELGFAMGTNKWTIVVGPQAFRLFCSLADACVETDADVIPAIARLT